MPYRLLFGLLTMIGFVETSAAQPSVDRPNIIILLADDMGWADVSYNGREIQTPHIDAWMEQGVRLDQFYVQPTCTPTRTALMTGRYPFRMGAHICVLRAHHQHGIPLEERFLSEALRDAGYHTVIAGKWHLGLARRAYWPTARGFDRFYGLLGGAMDYYSHDGYGAHDWQDLDARHPDNNRQPLREEGYATDLIGSWAVRTIEAHDFDAQPLFLYVPFNAPHTPLQAEPEDIARYQHIDDKKRRVYAAMMHAMDRQIDAIRAALEERGAADNTLVVFASDNGGSLSGGARNLPFRSGKGSLYEGGVRVPAFVVWPEQLRAGQAVDHPLHIVDLYPTLVKLAGGSLDQELPLDGIDFFPLLSAGTALPERDLFHNVSDRSGRGAIRSGPWKLVVTKARHAPEGGMPLSNPQLVAELFNLDKDPFEATNLAEQHPDRVQVLWDKLKAQGPHVGDARPYCAKAPEGWVAPADWSNAPD